MIDIYSPENIARSRERAAAIRVMVAEGILEPEWLDGAAAIEADATQREEPPPAATGDGSGSPRKETTMSTVTPAAPNFAAPTPPSWATATEELEFGRLEDEPRVWLHTGPTIERRGVTVRLERHDYENESEGETTVMISCDHATVDVPTDILPALQDMISEALAAAETDRAASNLAQGGV